LTNTIQERYAKPFVSDKLLLTPYRENMLLAAIHYGHTLSASH